MAAEPNTREVLDALERGDDGVTVDPEAIPDQTLDILLVALAEALAEAEAGRASS